MRILDLKTYKRQVKRIKINEKYTIANNMTFNPLYEIYLEMCIFSTLQNKSS